MRFFGVVGYGESAQALPNTGVYEPVIVEHPYRGDVVRNVMNQNEGENLNPDIRVNNSISIVADAYANEHFFNIKYVVWQGIRWTVSSVEVRTPRLILSLGKEYNGPTP